MSQARWPDNRPWNKYDQLLAERQKSHRRILRQMNLEQYVSPCALCNDPVSHWSTTPSEPDMCAMCTQQQR